MARKSSILAKVMKYELTYQEGCESFSDLLKYFWELQKQTQEILNRSTQIAFHWDYQCREIFQETGEYPDLNAETGYKRIDGYIYNCLKGQYRLMSSTNLTATI